MASILMKHDECDSVMIDVYLCGRGDGVPSMKVATLHEDVIASLFDKAFTTMKSRGDDAIGFDIDCLLID